MSRITLVLFLVILLDSSTIYCLRKAFPIFYTRHRSNILFWYFFVHLLLITGAVLGFLTLVPRIIRTISFVGLFISYFSKLFTLIPAIILLGLHVFQRQVTNEQTDTDVGNTYKSSDDQRLKDELESIKDLAFIEPGQQTTQIISRSAFIAKSGLVLAGLPLIALNAGMISGVYDYRVKHVNLLLPNLPYAFEGLTIAQISDIHSGSFYNKRAVTRGIDLLLSLKADIIFFTGDLVNDRIDEMKNYQDLFSKVKAPYGVFSILGNHDYGDYISWPSAKAKSDNLTILKKVHKIMGYDLLLNEHRKIKIGSDEIAILGIENWGALSHFPKYGRVDLALKGAEELPVKLLLSHDPSHWQAQVIPRFREIDMMFSGHTHGMQMGVRLTDFQWSPIQYVYPEWAGLYRSGHQQLYVNVGYGFLGYPGRIGILPEITLFKLSART